MDELSFTGLLAVVAIAFAAPLVLGLSPRVGLPAVVLEIVAGIVVGPAGLGWVEPDAAIEVIATIGLATLLFLAGLEVDVSRLRGPLLRLATVSFLVSIGLGVGAGLILQAIGAVDNALFVAIALTSTSLGVIVPVLKDAGEAEGPFGQLVIAAASIADIATIVLLSLLFSGEEGSVASRLLLLGGLVALALVVAASILAAERLPRIGRALLALQDTTAQIRVRGAVLLLILFVAVAQELGLEVILGAFVAGALLSVLDPDRAMTHPSFRPKLEALGFGFLIPVFFVTSGLRFDLGALTESLAAIVLVPVFLLALLAVRGAPAILYRARLGDRRALAAGLLQATSLPFLVAATQIGLELGVLDGRTAAGLVAAGLVSVLVFPLVALILLREGSDR